MNTTKNKTARLIRELTENDGWTATARLYELSVECPVRTFTQSRICRSSPTAQFVVVWSAHNPLTRKDETKVFTSNRNGQSSLFDMLTQAMLPGLGRFDEVLRVLGYEVESLPV